MESKNFNGREMYVAGPKEKKISDRACDVFVSSLFFLASGTSAFPRTCISPLPCALPSFISMGAFLSQDSGFAGEKSETLGSSIDFPRWNKALFGSFYIMQCCGSYWKRRTLDTNEG